MVTVYYEKVFPSLEEDAFSFQMEKISEDRREKILRLKNEETRLRSLTAGVLLQYALCEKTGISCEEAKPFPISYGEKGKPYLAGYPEVHFNLSHSGDYVCCAVSDGPVGVDIQKKVSRRKKLAERFFTPAERRMLSECGERESQELFFRMWSIKESYLKLTGEGLSGGLSGFEILWQERAVVRGGKIAAYFEESACPEGYSFCVCAEQRPRNVRWEMRRITPYTSRST